MNKITKFLIDLSIDVTIQSSLILYYFMNNHNFIIKNIVNFIPIFLFLIIILQIITLFIVSAVRYSNEQGAFKTLLNSTKEECKKCLLELNPRKNIFRKIYDKITDISLSILLVLTGHPFCFIMFIVSKVIFCLSKNMAKQTLEEMEK